jgi:hypothetical protein
MAFPPGAHACLPWSLRGPRLLVTHEPYFRASPRLHCPCGTFLCHREPVFLHSRRSPEYLQQLSRCPVSSSRVGTVGLPHVGCSQGGGACGVAGDMSGTEWVRGASSVRPAASSGKSHAGDGHPACLSGRLGSQAPGTNQWPNAKQAAHKPHRLLSWLFSHPQPPYLRASA